MQKIQLVQMDKCRQTYVDILMISMISAYIRLSHKNDQVSSKFLAFRPIDPLADSSQKSATKRSVECHPFATRRAIKHTIKTPRMHVDKNRTDAVSTTAVSLPKKLQPVRCKVSLALHLTYCTKSMCSRQMAVQR